jgi:hypothetical protein
MQNDKSTFTTGIYGDCGAGRILPRFTQPTLKFFKAVAALMAFVVIHDLPIWPKWDLRLMAPERAVVAVLYLHRCVPFRWNEHAFPAEMGAPVIVDSCESSPFHT